MISINALESELQNSAREHARLRKDVPFVRMALITAVVTPFLVVAFIFIPFVGQLLAISSCFLTVVYIRARRSWRLLFAALFGAGMAGILLALFGVYLTGYAALAGYLLMGFCVAVSIAYIIGMSGALWDFYNSN